MDLTLENKDLRHKAVSTHWDSKLKEGKAKCSTCFIDFHYSAESMVNILKDRFGFRIVCPNNDREDN